MGRWAPKHDFVIKSLHGTFTETSRASTKFFLGPGADLAEQKTLVELRSDGQAGPALGQDTRKRPNALLAPKHDFVIKSLHGTFTETPLASTKFFWGQGGSSRLS